MTHRKRESKARGIEKKDFRGTIRTRAGLIVGSTDTIAQMCVVSQKMTTGRATLNGKTIPIHPKKFAKAPDVFREAARLAAQEQP